MIRLLWIPMLVAALLWTGPSQHQPAAEEKAAVLAAQTETQTPDRTATQTAQAPTEQPRTGQITAAEAERIALTHAGFAREEVTRLHTETDYEKTGKEYEVSFRVGRWEYDYEICAETGRILEWEKDD